MKSGEAYVDLANTARGIPSYQQPADECVGIPASYPDEIVSKLLEKEKKSEVRNTKITIRT